MFFVPAETGGHFGSSQHERFYLQRRCRRFVLYVCSTWFVRLSKYPDVCGPGYREAADPDATRLDEAAPLDW